MAFHFMAFNFHGIVSPISFFTLNTIDTLIKSFISFVLLNGEKTTWGSSVCLSRNLSDSLFRSPFIYFSRLHLRKTSVYDCTYCLALIPFHSRTLRNPITRLFSGDSVSTTAYIMLTSLHLIDTSVVSQSLYPDHRQ